MSKALDVCALLYLHPANSCANPPDSGGILAELVEYCNHHQGQFVPITINAGLLAEHTFQEPQLKEQIIALAEKKHLFIAPFHDISPQAVYNGETLIRNLLLAFQVELRDAQIQRVVYLPTIFGLNSQLPQILRGFNIDAIILPEMKGSSGPGDQIFLWESSEGSALLTYRYLNPIKAGKQGGAASAGNLYLILLSRSGKPLAEEVAESLAHLPKDTTYRAISPEDFIWEIKDTLDTKELTQFKGEICGVINAGLVSIPIEYYLQHDLTLRQQLHKLENELLWKNEPLANIIKALGIEDLENRIAEQWRQLIELQALAWKGENTLADNLLDSVCGALKTHKNERQILSQTLCRQIKAFNATRQHSFWVLFNPHPMPRTEIIEAQLELPDNLNPDSLVMREVEGHEIPIQVVEKIRQNQMIPPLDPAKALYRCLIEVQNLPAMGWQTYHLIYQGAPKYLAAAPISVEKNALENDYLRVGIQSDGTLEIFGKETGTFWKGMGFFMDGLFIGPQKTSTFLPPLTTRDLTPAIKLLYNCPLGAAYQLDYHWELPIEYDPLTHRRSSRLASVYIKEVLQLNRLANFLDVRLEIECNVHDHQMAICFPLEFNPQVCVTDGFFGIEKRPLTESRQTRCTTMSMGNFIGFSNEDGGIALLVQGLREFNIMRGNPNIAALTLVKDFQGKSNEVCAELELQRRSYRLAIMPHLGNWDSSGILNEIARFNAPLEIVPASEEGGALPTRLQFLKISPENLIYSCLKSSEYDEGVILRLFNPTSNPIDGEVNTYLPIRSLRLLTLEEKIIASLEPDNETRFSLTIAPRKIATIKIVFQEAK